MRTDEMADNNLIDIFDFKFNNQDQQTEVASTDGKQTDDPKVGITLFDQHVTNQIEALKLAMLKAASITDVELDALVDGLLTLDEQQATAYGATVTRETVNNIQVITAVVKPDTFMPTSVQVSHMFLRHAKELDTNIDTFIEMEYHDGQLNEGLRCHIELDDNLFLDYNIDIDHDARTVKTSIEMSDG